MSVWLFARVSLAQLHQTVARTAKQDLAVMKANTENAARLLTRLAKDFPKEHPECPDGSDKALEFAIITPPEARDPDLVAKLDAVAGRIIS